MLIFVIWLIDFSDSNNGWAHPLGKHHSWVSFLICPCVSQDDLCFWGKHTLQMDLKMWSNPHLDLSAEGSPTWMAIKSKRALFVSPPILFYSECWKPTHWYIHYYSLYSLNPHNETLSHSYVCTLTHAPIPALSRDSLRLSAKLEHLVAIGPSCPWDLHVHVCVRVCV